MSPYSSVSLTRSFSAIACLLLSLPMSGCGQGGRPPMPPPAVNVAVVEPVTIPEWLTISGQLEGSESAEIRPRVSGYIDRVAYLEGSDVTQGTLLINIDDREFKAAADTANANLKRAEARLALANSELKRTESLTKSEAVSQSELEQRRSEANQALADRDSAAAQLKTAQLNVEFAHVSAPFTGRAGKAEVRTGNVVIANTTLLTTLVKLDPIYVNFTVDEQSFARMKHAGSRAKIRVTTHADAHQAHEGQIDFIDNQVDRSSGTIRLRGRLSNADHQLLPGLTVTVEVEASEPASHLLIAESAIQTDQDRQYVYVIGQENHVLRKDIVAGPHIGSLVSVTAGLGAGDVIVVDGTRKIFSSGQPVVPTRVDMNHPEGGSPAAIH